ncbi:hypothetical protein EDC04DRAFT_2964113 [Pisolithus marmoratus]|nr:hypothetical protein EDC04DRAFT_2964113 [Pisolithus marmoratus]
MLKKAYSQSAGWLYWNFKTEISNLTGGTKLACQWSYLEALNTGLLPQNSASYFNDNVCEPYINKTIPKSRSGPVKDIAISNACVENPSAPGNVASLKPSSHRRRRYLISNVPRSPSFQPTLIPSYFHFCFHIVWHVSGHKHIHNMYKAIQTMNIIGAIS